MSRRDLRYDLFWIAQAIEHFAHRYSILSRWLDAERPQQSSHDSQIIAHTASRSHFA
jgi:hypothetical protein